MIKSFFAELFGTFTLVFVACGTAVVTGCQGQTADSAYFLTAAAFGLTLACLVYLIGPISGCHVNPAVSFAKLLEKKLGLWDFLLYVAAQCFGAIAGGALLYFLLGTGGGLGQNVLFEESIWKTLLVEALLTCLFVLSVLVVSERASLKNAAGLILGSVLTLVHVFGIAFTGTSVNPARSLGVSIFVGGEALSSVWVFWVGPLLGAFVAYLLRLCFSGKGRADKAEQ